MSEILTAKIQTMSKSEFRQFGFQTKPMLAELPFPLKIRT